MSAPEKQCWPTDAGSIVPELRGRSRPIDEDRLSLCRGNDLVDGDRRYSLLAAIGQLKMIGPDAEEIRAEPLQRGTDQIDAILSDPCVDLRLLDHAGGR